MKILVTGGAGFIGSNLVEELVGKGNEVAVIDDLSVTDKNVKLLKKWGVELFKKDVGDFEAIKDCFHDVEVVFHLAAMNRAQRSIQDPLKANRTNVDGTLNCLEAARRAGVDRFIFASSSSVYAGERNKLLTEDMPLTPPHPYGVGKLAGEHYCRIYYELFGLKMTVLRFFSVYGPRQLGTIENAAVIPKFIELIRKGLPVEVYGDGTQLRNFTYVKDLVEVVIKTAENEETVGDIYNVASDKEVSVNQIINEIAGVLGNKTEINYVAKLKGDPDRNPADISKIKEVLGWNPKTEICQGIRETISSQLPLR